MFFKFINFSLNLIFLFFRKKNMRIKYVFLVFLIFFRKKKQFLRKTPSPNFYGDFGGLDSNLLN